jgi:hypothetical protein
MKVKEGDIFKSFLTDQEYIIKKVFKRFAMLQSQNGKRQILTEVDNLKIKSFYPGSRRPRALPVDECASVWPGCRPTGA